MGRGTSRTRRAGGGGGVNPANIKNVADLQSERGLTTAETEQLMAVSKYVTDTYGEDVGNFVLADITGKDSNTLAYYDGTNIGFNRSYYNSARMDGAMNDCADSGWHPPIGNKTGIEAVAAHEFGHALTDAVGKKMGTANLHDAATNILNEARKAQGKHRGVVQMSKAISDYATSSNAEAIAEAFADVYCNGTGAKAESRAIMNVVNSYLK